MVKILSIDDHAIIRKGILRILEESNDIEAICDEASTAREAFKKVSSCCYDLLLLDISMPGGSGLDLLKQLHRDYPGLPVLLLSMFPEEQFAIRALSLGAVGYLTKESAHAELITAVKKVLSGGRYITSSLAELLSIQLGSGRKPCELLHEALSNREYQVFRLIGASRTPTQIAAELCLSTKTVSTYRTRILRKLGMVSTVELITYVLKHNLHD